MRKIFINEYGRLRSGWRLVLYVFAFIAASVLIGTGLQLAYLLLVNVVPQISRLGFLADLIFRFGLLAAALIAGYLCVRIFEGLPWRSLGLTLHRGWFRDLVIGSAVGFGTLAVAVGIAATAGGLNFSINDVQIASVGRSMLGSATLLFVAALAEEAAFRGYPLQTLTRAKLTLLGVLLTSLPFGLVHLTNPNVAAGFTFANTSLAGVWLAVAYLRTRSLWLPLGVHWSWNWALGWFFGLPISGINLVSHPLLKASDSGPAWLTGGSYGIEGGLACTIALILFTLFLWRTSWVSATPELLKLTSEENPAIPSSVVSIHPADDHA
jgi:membrane protease YdiL (CAAX protease family)